MIDDLDSLISTVSSWLGGSSDPGFTTAIRTSIELTEADLNRGFMGPDGRRSRGLRVAEMVEIATAEFNELYERLPPGCLEVRAAYYVDDQGVETPLSAVTDERIAWFSSQTNWCGCRHYVVTGQLIRFGPRVAGTPVNIRLVYYRQVPPLLTDGDPTVLQAYPQVYLHGTLAHMAGYVIDDPRIATWKSMFMSAVLAANAIQRDRAGSYAA